MHIIFLVILLCYLTVANAQKSTSPKTAQTETILSEVELLDKSKELKTKDNPVGSLLLNKVLSLSKQKNHQSVAAQANFFLGESELRSKNIVQAVTFFLNASQMYKKINDPRYKDADKIIDDILPIAQEYDKTRDVALLLLSKSDLEYQKKHYDDAIVLYLHAVNYLSSPDKATQKNLGRAYTYLAQSYKRLNQKEQTAFYYKKALTVFTELQDLKNKARTLNTLAEAERKLNNYFSSLDYSIEAIELHKKIDDPVGHAKALTGAGIIYRYIGLYEKSLEYILKAHLFYKKAKITTDIAKTSNQMGLIYTRLKQFEEARSFYQLTIDLPEKKVEPQTLASALREIAVINTNIGNYQAAKITAMKAYKIYKKIDDKKYQSLIARIIGNIYRGELNYPQAIAYYRESLSIATEIGNKLYQTKAQTPLAAMLFATDIEESMVLLKKAVAISTEIDSNTQKLYAYRELRKAEKLRGNYKESLGYAELEILYTGIIQKEKEDNELVKLKATLYSQKLEMELVSLKKKVTLDKLELEKNKYASVALTLLLLLSVLLSILMYIRFIASKKKNKELDYLATRDPLTNCYNRRALLARMEQDFNDKESLGEYCLIMSDIDHFKLVNDIHGHIEGDAVIRMVVDLFQHCVRQKDIVARFGGEEFCIILHGVGQTKAMKIAEKMRYKIEHANYNGISVTCSFGVTSTKFNAKYPSELIVQADAALYKSKSLGRNKVTLWNREL